MTRPLTQSDLNASDKPCEGLIEVEPPGWFTIAVCWGAGLGLIFMIWSF